MGAGIVDMWQNRELGCVVIHRQKSKNIRQRGTGACTSAVFLGSGKAGII
jgi:hypothetical protein